MQIIAEADQWFHKLACGGEDGCLCRFLLPQTKNFFLCFSSDPYGFPSWKCKKRFRLKKTATIQRKRFHPDSVDYVLLGEFSRKKLKKYADDMCAVGRMTEVEAREMYMWCSYFEAREKQITAKGPWFSPEEYMHAWRKCEDSDIAGKVLLKNCGWCKENKLCVLAERADVGIVRWTL